MDSLFAVTSLLFRTWSSCHPSKLSSICHIKREATKIQHLMQIFIRICVTILFDREHEISNMLGIVLNVISSMLLEYEMFIDTVLTLLKYLSLRLQMYLRLIRYCYLSNDLLLSIKILSRKECEDFTPNFSSCISTCVIFEQLHLCHG